MVTGLQFHVWSGHEQRDEECYVYQMFNLGPLQTWSKSRDHEIVRAQKIVSKGRPEAPPKSRSVVTDPQV